MKEATLESAKNMVNDRGMKIEIDYNGAYAVCRVNGKYLYQCDSLIIAQTFSAFRTIEQHFRREGKLPKEEQSLDKVINKTINYKNTKQFQCRYWGD